jgi:molybdopterin-guanine dinucleotide biosynthesis protein MobB
MKIIQVAGLANTGKTTFIRDLIPALSAQGKVAVIKHLGDHEFNMEDGKDTTVFFEAGAEISVGIDAEKSVIATRKNALDDILRLCKHQQIDFVVLEGFKERKFPRIVIGDLIIDNCVLANPRVNDVIDSLDAFEDFN